MMNSKVFTRSGAVIITTINNFTEYLNQNGQCDVLLLDFCKASDKVAYTRLFLIMEFIIHSYHGSFLF